MDGTQVPIIAQTSGNGKLFQQSLNLLQKQVHVSLDIHTHTHKFELHLFLGQFPSSLGDVNIGLLAHHVAESASYTLQHITLITKQQK